MLIFLLRHLGLTGVMGIPFVGVKGAMRDLLGSYFFHFSHESGDLLGMRLDFSIGVVDPLE